MSNRIVIDSQKKRPNKSVNRWAGPGPKTSYRSLYLYTLFATLVWSLLMALSGLWSVHVGQRQMQTMVENEARTHFNKDQAFRFWSASHDGVYVPITRKTPPNPNLSHVPERDIMTPSGRQLTLMNPAYMMQQLMTDYEKLYGIKGRITGLKVLNPLNTPDAWEKKALLAFEKGVQEVKEYTEIEGKPYLRLMRPMITKRGCVKCHAVQGYREGDIRGGVGISLPLTPYITVNQKTKNHTLIAYAAIWLVGLIVTTFVYRRAKYRRNEQLTYEDQLGKWVRIFEHAKWGIMVSGTESSSLDMMNPAFADLHGYTVEELTGKPLPVLVEKSGRDDVSAHFMVAHEKGHHTFESLHLRKDGSTFPVILDVTVVGEKNDAAAYQIVNVQDISARKDVENQIAEARDEWIRTFNAISDIVIILDPNLRVIKTNTATEKHFNVLPGDLTGRKCFELFHKTSSPCDECPAVKSIVDLSPHTAQIEQHNQTCSYLASSSPLLDEAGNLAGIVHVAKDITKQKNLELQLRQAQKMEAIGTLAGGIAHDFNNLLAPILGYAEILQETLNPKTKEGHRVHEIYKAGLRAKDLVKQILGFSRQAEQKLSLIEPHLIIKEALKLLRASIPTTIEIKEDIDSHSGKIMADPTQIHQVIVNLCTNAYQAMQNTGGILGVSLQPLVLSEDDVVAKVKLEPGSYLMIEVSDTGPGMTPDIIEKIFNPYFTTKSKKGGTGMGLATVDSIIKDHGGHISVYSEPGTGTTFHVYLPRVEGEEAADKESLNETQGLTGTERILIVDDEEAIAQLEREMLESLGYKVSMQTESVTAWQIFESDPESFDLVITDMAMPHMTGMELAKNILSVRQNFPIILCTGFSEMLNKEQARDLGIREYLMKPVVKNKLAKTIRQVLNNRGTES